MNSAPGRPGLAGVEPVDVGEQDERVGVHQVGDQRGQPVVVAEPDLVGGHGVVLVDDRDDAELEQPVERAVGVAVVPAPVQVVGGEQHLPDAQAVPGERRRRSARPAAAARRSRRPAGWRGRAGGRSARAGRCPRRWRRTRPGRPAGRPRRRAASASTMRVQPVGVEPAARGERRRADLDDGARAPRRCACAGHPSSSRRQTSSSRCAAGAFRGQARSCGAGCCRTVVEPLVGAAAAWAGSRTRRSPPLGSKSKRHRRRW